MHRDRIEKLFDEIQDKVEMDSSSLTRDDQDRIFRMLGLVREEVARVYDEREASCGIK